MGGLAWRDAGHEAAFIDRTVHAYIKVARASYYYHSLSLTILCIIASDSTTNMPSHRDRYFPGAGAAYIGIFEDPRHRRSRSNMLSSLRGMNPFGRGDRGLMGYPRDGGGMGGTYRGMMNGRDTTARSRRDRR